MENGKLLILGELGLVKPFCPKTVIEKTILVKFRKFVLRLIYCD